MPRPIQTLTFADVLTRIFKLTGKAKLEADEQVIPTVDVDVTDTPFVADGRHPFSATIACGAAVANVSHCALVNPVAEGGLCVCDYIMASSTDATLRVGYSRASLAAGSRVFSTLIPWRAGVASSRQLPPLVRLNNTGGPYGTTLVDLPPDWMDAGNVYQYRLRWPLLLPGRVDEEELVVRTVNVNFGLTVNFFGRWYPGIKASELL